MSCVARSIIGAVLIVFGLYTVVWGKSKDSISSSTMELTNEKGGPRDQLPIQDNGRLSSTSFANSNQGPDDGMSKQIPPQIYNH